MTSETQPQPQPQAQPQAGSEDRTEASAAVARGGWWARLRRHPVITATFVVCAVGGALAALELAPESWPLWRRLLAGAFSGTGVGLLVTATRMFG